MSRDAITITIVLVCIAALVFLFVKTLSLANQQTSEPGEDYNYLYNDPNETAERQDTAGFYPGEADGGVSADPDRQPEDPSPEYVDDEELPVNQTNEPEKEVNKPVPTTSLDADGNYWVLAGNFSVKSNAENEARRLKRLGYSNADVAIVRRGAYAAVIVDRFSSANSARELVRELKSKHNLEAYVSERK